MAENSSRNRTLAQYLDEKLKDLVADTALKAVQTDRGQKYLTDRVDQAIATKDIEPKKYDEHTFKGRIMTDPRMKKEINAAFHRWLAQDGNMSKLLPVVPKYLGIKLRQAGEWALENPGQATALTALVASPFILSKMSDMNKDKR